MSRNEQTWKFRRTLLDNEEPFRAQTLQNVKFLEGLTSDKTRTSQRLIFFVLENDDVTWKPRSEAANSLTGFARTDSCQLHMAAIK